MESRLNNIRELLKKAHEKWFDLYELLQTASENSKNFDLDFKCIGKERSFSGLNLLIITVLDYLDELLPRPDNDNGISPLINEHSSLHNIEKCLISLSDKFSDIYAQLKPLRDNPSLIETVTDGPKLVLSNIGEINLSPQIIGIENTIRDLVESATAINSLITINQRVLWTA